MTIWFLISTWKRGYLYDYLYKYEVHFSLDVINLTDCCVNVSNGYMQRVSAMSQKQTYLRNMRIGW